MTENYAKVPWGALPDELWMEIFSGLNIAELGIAARVCKQWNRLASDERLWKTRFCAKWSSEKEKSSEISWRSEYKRFLYHVPSVETDVLNGEIVTRLAFSKNGEFFVSSSNFDRILFWKTDQSQPLYIFYGRPPLHFLGFNDTGNLALIIWTDWKTGHIFLLVYRFDPTESGEDILVLIDRWKPEFDELVTDSISWLDSTRYLVAMRVERRGCLVQVCSATRPRKIEMSYYFQDIQCSMLLLAAEIPSECQKKLIFACGRKLNTICIKTVADNEVSDRPTKPDYCITVEGPIAGIALMDDKKTLIVNCRTDQAYYGPLELDDPDSLEMKIQLVDLVTLRTQHPLLGHVSSVYFPVSAPISSGSLIACRSADPFVYIFDTEHNCCVQRLPHGSGIDALAWNPADKEMLLTANDGKIRLWKSRNREPNRFYW